MFLNLMADELKEERKRRVSLLMAKRKMREGRKRGEEKHFLT